MKTIANSGSTKKSKQDRIDQMLKIIFGKNLTIFPYFPGHSTVASETWKNKYGDCISLTLLTYAVSKAMDLPATMQEVRTPTLFDRRDNVDYVNAHVNLMIENSETISIREKVFASTDLVIDFEPGEASFVRGTALTEEGIAARFYNNLGAEYLAKNKKDLAYAYFKEAILTDPSYASSFSNLAQLYKSRHLMIEAEKMLKYALSISENSYITLRSLVELMNEEHKTEEAKIYVERLKQAQESTPYYWLDLGVKQVRNNQFYDAIYSLEKASSMTQGFEEIHFNLAIAYWRTHQPIKAREQLEKLKSIHPDSTNVLLLGRKFQ